MKTTVRFIVLLVLVGVQALVPVSAQARAGSSRTASMPMGLYDAFLDATSKDGTAFHLDDSGYSLEAQDLRVQLNNHGLSISPQGGDGWWWGVELNGFGRQGQTMSLSAPKAAQADGRAELNYAGQLSEWYRESGVGLEQGFTIDQNPAGKGMLVLQMQLDTILNGSLAEDKHSLSFAAGDGQVLHYSGLRAFDAKGLELDAELVYEAKQLSIQIDDHGAAYPITVDPLIYLEAEQVAPDGAANDQFGWSVAISGNTAIIGSPGHKVGSNTSQGVVYVFVRTSLGVTWGQQAELSASDGAAGDRFGNSVAISGDTAVIGAPRHNGNHGEAYVFLKPAGGWSNGTETARLTASDSAANDYFGSSVAISGSTAIVGSGHISWQGEVYVFVKPAGGWTDGTETARLTASDGAANDMFGDTVAVSGNTVVVGAYGHNSARGEAYVFVKPASGWATGTETAKLTASDGAASEYFGGSVAISGDTAVVGADGHPGGAGPGEAYVFVKPVSGWATGTENARLTGSDSGGNDVFGGSVAIDGDTVVVGAFGQNSSRGEAYVFVRPPTGWSTGTETYRLNASDGVATDQFGIYVAISAETAVIGAYGRNSQQGAAYIYFPYRTNQDLGVGAAAAPTYARAGQTVTFTASVTNYSPGSASAVQLAASLPAGFTLVSSSATHGSYNSSTGSWSVGTLAFGVTATLNIQAKVKTGTGGTNPAFKPRLLGWDMDNTNNTASAVMHILVLSFNPASLSFADQLIQTASATQMVTVTNASKASATLGTLSAPAGFTLSANTCNGKVLATSGTCSFAVKFKPASVAAYVKNLSVPLTSPAYSDKLAVSGHGVAGTQLLTNTSFETCSGTPPVPTGWSKGGTWVSGDGCNTSQKHTGSQSLKLTGKGVVKSLTFSKVKSGVAGDDFLFTVWRKASSVPSGATLDARVKIFNGSTLVTAKKVTIPVGTYGFTKSSLPFTMTGAYTKLVVILEYKGASGTVWFDDASLVWAP